MSFCFPHMTYGDQIPRVVNASHLVYMDCKPRAEDQYGSANLHMLPKLLPYSLKSFSALVWAIFSRNSAGMSAFSSIERIFSGMRLG